RRRGALPHRRQEGVTRDGLDPGLTATRRSVAALTLARTVVHPGVGVATCGILDASEAEPAAARAAADRCTDHRDSCRWGSEWSYRAGASGAREACSA